MYFRLLFLLLVILIAKSELCYCARILGICPSPSYSHQVVFRPIWRELSKRGHDLVVITTDPENDPNLNIKEIDISFAYDLWNNKHNIIDKIEKLKNNPLQGFNSVYNAFLDICKQELLHPEIQALLKNNTEYFDLLIVEYTFPIMFAFAERFNCPYIGVLSLDLPNIIHSLLGNPAHSIAYPDVVLPFEGKLNFMERVISTLFDLYMNYASNFRDESADLDLLNEHFKIKLPTMHDIRKNVSLVFVNVNPAFNTRPLGPAIIPIGGGTHVKPIDLLPKDLQEFLDNAKNGVIYFSLGTNLQSKRITSEMRKVMLNTFKELPYRVLWKFDSTDIEDIPQNVKIVPWLPQQDILRHPNIKVFITQGGLQSMEEAVFSHVPLVAIPFFGDQYTNVHKIVAKGFGVSLDKDSLTIKSFKEAIVEVINNPKYKLKIIETADLSKDQPMTGIEKAVWWTEYILKHKGARHLRNPAMDLPFYQYYLIDVVGFLLAIISIIIFTLIKVVFFTKKIIIGMITSKQKIKNN